MCVKETTLRTLAYVQVFSRFLHMRSQRGAKVSFVHVSGIVLVNGYECDELMRVSKDRK